MDQASVPVGYVITVAVIAVCTLLALVPLRRPWSLGQLTWRLTFLLDEQPVLVLLWLAAATALAFAQGDIATPVSWVAFGFALASGLALVFVLLRGLRGRRVVARAVREDLGVSWQPPRLSWARVLLLPFHVRRRDVERIPDVSYGPAGRHHLLDVYRPRRRAAGGPTLVYLHGGGLMHGSKRREAQSMLHDLASRGWVCVSANYRLAPQAVFPDQFEDVRRVLAWVRGDGVDLGADPRRVFVAGSSAGGYLATMTALEPGADVAGAISLYGFHFAPTWVPVRTGAVADPMDLLGPDSPPLFLAHGKNDTFVPVDTARRFARRARELSRRPVVYVELPGAQHTFDMFHSVRFDTVVGGLEAFAAAVTSVAGPPRGTPDHAR